MPRKPLRSSLVALLLVAVSTSVRPARAAPANDDFERATVVPALAFRDLVDTTGATMQPGEFSPCYQIGAGATVWYRLPASPGVVRVSTHGSSFDTVLTAYTGESLLTLRPVGCDDDGGGPGGSSQLTVTVAAGSTVYVQVGGVREETGALALSVEPVPSAPVLLCHECGFATYTPPPHLDHRAGETSIGVNPRTNAAMFLMLTRTMRVRWDDTTTPPEATWEDVSGPLTSLATNDPILWTDPATGRTFVAQLRAGLGSVIEYTDDDGGSWVATEPGVVLPSWDHQTIGGGPAVSPLQTPLYPNAVYYCAQAGVALAQCARSDNGGLTWGAPVPMNVGSCSGLHGHAVVGPDGTVYVPHKSCSGSAGRQQGVMVSRDGGHVWALSLVPGTRSTLSDPAVALDAGGRAYFVGTSEGRPIVSASDDGGATWSQPIDLGAPFGIRNSVFPMAVAGDAGRAAVAFYGAKEQGNDQSADYRGTWHLYVSFTFDGGATWKTVDVTPHDPVQRGCIWLQGGFNPCRNLLDFQGMTVDAHGRVLVGYADGCVSAACLDPAGTPDDSRASRGAIARQIDGGRLFAQYDPD